MTKESEREWAARLQEWHASGVSATEFCKDQQYAATTLYWWSSRLRRSAESPYQGKRARSSPSKRAVTARNTPPVPLARVVRAPTVASVPNSTAVVVQVGQIRVEVAAGVDRATLSTVFETLAVIRGQR